MKKLFDQIMKFGIVGFVCFFIDYIVGIVTLNAIMAVSPFGQNSFEIGSQIGAALGFTVSVIVNYLLSFKFVFQRKENLNRKAEFTIFLVLSVIGLVINQLIIALCTVVIYGHSEWLQQNMNYNMMYTGAKVAATAIVMVYNFVTRKKFLEQKDTDEVEETENKKD